jgi:glycosyltransferase involved in cell wall biosynthesis
VRICLLIGWPITPDLKQRIAAGEHPNMEVFDLACKLKAEIIDTNLATQSRSFLVRVGYFFGQPLGLALLAWQRRGDFDLFYVGSEKIGILVAALFKFVNRRPRLIILNHYLSNPKKAFLFSRLRLQNTVDALICLNEYQATFLERDLAVSPRKVVRVQYGAMVDGAFFLPRVQEGDKQQYVLSVGRENRDYATLFEALRNSQMRAKIVASGMRDSRAYRNTIADGRLHNVETLEHISYTELRNLYGDCAFVAIPMHNVDYPAGMTAIMEAMAMGKAVIATYSRGIEEFIDNAVTGFWTEPGNPIALREKMLFLWNNPKLTIEMGKRARESVQSRVDLIRFVEELESILTSLE